MKIYIAGPITGVFDYKKNFKATEEKLSSMGHIVLNPAILPSGLKDYMKICKAMIDEADAVFFKDGWESSLGSNEEYQYACATNKRIINKGDAYGD